MGSHFSLHVRQRIRRLGAEPTGPEEPERTAVLGERTLTLEGRCPRVGDRIEARFTLPGARHAGGGALTEAELSRGLVIVSTLPNIAKQACTAQVVALDHALHHGFEDARAVHVSADGPERWAEVDQYHPDVDTPAYTLEGATAESRDAFARQFGVAVRGERRIAHGLFALLDGAFIAAHIPGDQLTAADVDVVLREAARVLGRPAPGCGHHAPTST